MKLPQWLVIYPTSNLFSGIFEYWCYDLRKGKERKGKKGIFEYLNIGATILYLSLAHRLILHQYSNPTFTDYFEDCGVVQVEGRVYPVEELFLDEIAPILFEKDPKVLGPAFAAAGLGLEEKSFKYRCMVESPYHKDGVCGFGYNMHCPLEGRLADGLAKHDVLQEIRGLTHDVKLLVALIRNIDETDRVDSPTCAHDRAILVFLPGWDDVCLS